VDSGLPRTALDFFTAAINADPSNRDAAESAAALLEFANMPDFALPFRQVALRAAPTDPATRQNWRHCLRRSYRLTEAAGPPEPP
jgi:hypothetical protein